ncbi:MAG: signal peptidase II [Bifidobacterium aquikefiri]|uniref:Lipoprotein signal peptidase n=1 Tax=Bifidobacterium aquikefiri TaxID=1653207 RepID=A0A261G295_9BIFI|nr:signal peptidase II [Bifidobacterium aquikefiri]OZG65498.1 lipoprotein signal peptidase [Bifidobacterium aquikefiri]
MTSDSNAPSRIAAQRPRRSVAVFSCVALIGLIVDRVSKLLALRYLSLDESRLVIPRLLSLRLLRNPGASLGFGSNSTWVISILAIAACIVLVILAIRSTSTLWVIVLGMAFAGAAGNLIDRVVYADGMLNGKVVDFLDYGWSVGNVADIFLMFAGIGMVVLVFMGVPWRISGQSADAHDSDE